LKKRKEKKSNEALDPILQQDALTRIFAMRSYTPFLQKSKKQNKEGEEKPKTNSEYLERKKQNKTKSKEKIKEKRKEQHRVSIEPTPTEAQKL
jgi:hypothetical protein